MINQYFFQSMRVTQKLTESTRENKIRKLQKHLNFKNRDGVKSQANDQNALKSVKILQSVQ